MRTVVTICLLLVIWAVAAISWLYLWYAILAAWFVAIPCEPTGGQPPCKPVEFNVNLWVNGSVVVMTLLLLYVTIRISLWVIRRKSN